MANITRYTPFDDLLGDFAKGFWLKPVQLPGGEPLKMKIDVKEDEKTFTVHADIPGVKKEDIRVDVQGDQVSIRAGSRSRRQRFPRLYASTLSWRRTSLARNRWHDSRVQCAACLPSLIHCSAVPRLL